jgi:hypothetical protein
MGFHGQLLDQQEGFDDLENRCLAAAGDWLTAKIQSSAAYLVDAHQGVRPRNSVQ